MAREVVLITGCSSGLGRQLCVSLKERGYVVVASARNPEKFEELDADMKVQIDVSDDISVQRGVREIIDEFGKIDILINNAGYSFRYKSVEQIVKILEKKSWKTRYTVSLPIVFSILLALPDRLKETLIRKFN